MSLKELIFLIGQLLARCLSENGFTGKITITIHCRNGGIGKATSNIERDFVRKDLTFSAENDIFINEVKAEASLNDNPASGQCDGRGVFY